MAITLIVEKTVNGDVKKGYLVKDFNLLPYEKLPNMYLKIFPHCYPGTLWGDSFIDIYETPENCIRITKGDFITPEKLEKVVRLLRVCGENLKKVNQKIKEAKEKWNGVETYTI